MRVSVQDMRSIFLEAHILFVGVRVQSFRLAEGMWELRIEEL